MHRHVLAVPRLARGSHTTPPVSGRARDIAKNALYRSKGRMNPVPPNAAEREATPLAKRHLRQRMPPGRTATKGTPKPRHERQLINVETEPSSSLLDSPLSQTRPERNDLPGAEFEAYSAEVRAATTDDALVYLAPDELDELDIPQVVLDPETARPLLQPTQTAQWAPRTPGQLYQRLLDLINGPLHRTHPRPSPVVHTIVDYHERYSALNSTKTYNLVIEYAIWRTDFRAAYQLITRMRRHGDQALPNLQTEVLTVRLLVRVGRWDEAWARCWEADGPAHRWARAHPFPFWLEFFAFVSPAIPWGRARFWKIDRHPPVENAQLRNLLEHIPRLTGFDFDHAPPRFVAALVFRLLSTDRRATALDIARGFLRGLPATLSAEANRDAVRMIDLFASFGYEAGLPWARVRDTFNELMGMHPALRPGPASIAMVIRTLRYAENGGRRARNYLRWARARWGTRVEDATVRRIIAQMALINDRRDIVYAMFKGQDHYKMYRHANNPNVVSEILGEEDKPDERNRGRERRMPTAILNGASRQGLEATLWVSLARKVERKWGQWWYEDDLREDGKLKREALEDARNSL